MLDISRRHFARLLALGGTTALFPEPALGDVDHHRAWEPLPPTPAHPHERFWSDVRARFLLPDQLAFMNAANLCPSPLAVVEALEGHTRSLERDPSPATKVELSEGREETRRLVAASLGVTAEEIVLTRNTSEANNLVSSGLALGPGDDVVVFADNHRSNLAAWSDKADRFGFTVRPVEQVNPHPGAEYYVDAFARATTPRTRVLAFTHVTNTVGDLFPAAALCQLAREREVLTVVDGAQSFGVLAVNLAEMRPDFFTGSAHKWPCGPKETGLLYVNRDVHDRIWPSVVSLYPGAVGISRKLEGMGQRDEAALAALGHAVRFQSAIGRAVIESRARELAQALIAGLRAMDGITLWTHPDPDRSAAVVSFQPGSLDPRRLARALYERDAIVCAVRAGDDRPGIRLSPHCYNLETEVQRVLAAVQRYLATGV